MPPSPRTQLQASRPLPAPPRPAGPARNSQTRTRPRACPAPPETRRGPLSGPGGSWRARRWRRRGGGRCASLFAHKCSHLQLCRRLPRDQKGRSAACCRPEPPARVPAAHSWRGCRRVHALTSTRFEPPWPAALPGSLRSCPSRLRLASHAPSPPGMAPRDPADAHPPRDSEDAQEQLCFPDGAQVDQARDQAILAEGVRRQGRPRRDHQLPA